MKHELIKKISKIHAIKCWKATDMAISIESFNTVVELKERTIASANEEDWAKINASVNVWAGTNPIATNREIDDLMSN